MLPLFIGRPVLSAWLLVPVFIRASVSQGFADNSTISTLTSSGNILSTNLFNDSSNNAVSVNVTPFGQDLSPQDVLLDIIGGIMTLYRGRKGVLVQEFTFSYAGLPVTGILQWPGRLPSRLTTEVLAEGLEQVAKKLAISRQYKEMMIEISENGEGLVARGSIRSKNPTTAILSLDTS